VADPTDAALAKSEPEEKPRVSGRRSAFWSTVVALGISLGLLAWALRGVEFDALVESIGSMHVAPMIVAVIIVTLLFPLKIFRWRLLLRQPDGEHVSPLAMWHAIAMGFMANNILPLRIGEVVRTFAVSRLGNVGLGAALSSIAVERIFDGLTLVALLALALFLADIPADVTLGSVSLTHAASVAGALAAGALAAAIAVVVFPRAAERLVAALIPNNRLSARLIAILEDLQQGMQALRSPARVASVVAWSAALWFTNGVAFYVAFQAFDIPVDMAGALLVLGVLALGVAAPSAPGFVGVFEAAILLVLGRLYGVTDDVAVAYALTFHAITFLPITLLGLWSVARTGLGLRGLRAEATSFRGGIPQRPDTET
jgi:uncharacterized protein (TIRG00374 family)